MQLTWAGIALHLACHLFTMEHVARSPTVEVAIRQSDSGRIRLLIMLVNDVNTCRPVWVTPQLARHRSGPTVLSLAVRSAADGTIVIREGIEVVRQVVSPADMYLLDCGSVLGQVIDSTAPMTEWPLKLTTGKYEIQACVTSNLERFALEHSSWADRFRELKLTSKIKESAVQDFHKCSTWVTLTVQ